MITLLFTASMCAATLGTSEFLSQTVVAEYGDDSGMLAEVVAFDYATGATLRIEASGRILLYTPDGRGYEGVAGLADLRPSERVNAATSPAFATPAIPAAGLYQLEHFTGFERLGEDGPFGGPVFSGSFPLGDPALAQIDGGSTGFEYRELTVSYLLDERGYLREIRDQNEQAVHAFDAVDTHPPRHVAALSLAGGSLVLLDHRVAVEGDRSVFEPRAVAERARVMAFEQAEAERDAEREMFATDVGRTRMEHARNRQFDSSSVGPRFALISTGVLLVAIGLVGWWKRR